MLVPRLLGWEHPELSPEAQKTFEVALHAGSAPALVVAVRRIGIGSLRFLPLTLLPPALFGGLLEGPIERRLGRVELVCIGQVLGGVGLLVADRSGRRRTNADALDHLAVGFAQAAALAPGVSRFGAAMSAARWRGLSRRQSVRLALRAALPVTVAAGALKGARMVGGGLEPRARASLAPLATGAGAALVSSLASLPLLRLPERRGALAALGCYRIALGVAVLLREHRRGGGVAGSPPASVELEA